MRIPRHQSVRFIAALAVSICVYAAFTPKSQAQNAFDPDRAARTVNIFDATVHYPVPGWVTSQTELDQFQPDVQQNDTRFILESFPQGETFSNWLQAFSISGFYVPEHDVPLTQVVESGINVFRRACGDSNTTSKELSTSAQTITYLVMCAASPNGPTDLGYGPNVGEVALKTARRYKDTYVELYHEWRGPKFDPKDTATWPVSQEMLDEMIRRFDASISLGPSPNPPRP